MVCPHGIPVEFLLDFHEDSMESLWHFNGISVGFLSVSCRVSMVFLLDFYHISTEVLLAFSTPKKDSLLKHH